MSKQKMQQAMAHIKAREWEAKGPSQRRQRLVVVDEPNRARMTIEMGPEEE